MKRPNQKYSDAKIAHAKAIHAENPKLNAVRVAEMVGLPAHIVRAYVTSKPSPRIAPLIEQARAMRLADPNILPSVILAATGLTSSALQVHLRDLPFPREAQSEISRQKIAAIMSDPIVRGRMRIKALLGHRRHKARRAHRRAALRNIEAIKASLATRQDLMTEGRRQAYERKLLSWCHPDFVEMFKELVRGPKRLKVSEAKELVLFDMKRRGLAPRPQLVPFAGKATDFTIRSRNETGKREHDPAEAYDLVHNQGMTVLLVSERLNVSPSTISKSLRRYSRKNGLPLRNLTENSGRKPKVDGAVAYDLYHNKGLTQWAIANRFQCTQPLITMVLKRYAKANGLPLRPPKKWVSYPEAAE